jgi:predicted amidohydrolase YtcJ
VAAQYDEADSKGSLKVGKRADLVVLSANPLKVDPSTIKDLSIAETIKDGKSVYVKK